MASYSSVTWKSRGSIIRRPLLFRKSVLKFHVPFRFLKRRVECLPDQLFLLVESIKRASSVGISDFFDNEFRYALSNVQKRLAGVRAFYKETHARILRYMHVCPHDFLRHFSSLTRIKSRSLIARCGNMARARMRSDALIGKCLSFRRPRRIIHSCPALLPGERFSAGKKLL